MTQGKNTGPVLAEQLIAGTKKHFPNAVSLTFGSGAFTPAQIEASLQTLIDLRAAVDATKMAAKAKVAAEIAQAPPLRKLMAAYAAFVKVTFTNSPDILGDFGLKPRKARIPPTIDEKAAAAARRAATRLARHTMGTKQKKNVKGTITTIVTPTPSTASPPSTATPASAKPMPATPPPGAPPNASGVAAAHPSE